MNKKGFELSINFIVMLILAIAVFGFGLYFAQSIFHQAEKIKAQMDTDTENVLRSSLDRGERVAIAISSKDIKPGQLATFGLGILNVDDTAVFSIQILCRDAVMADQTVILQETACKDVGILPSTSPTPYTVALQKNEQKLIPIAIQIPASKTKATYPFSIIIKVNGQNYVQPKQVYVNII